MKAVIMAGGKGVRLRPFTYVEPKPLLTVGSINPIEYSIKYLKKCGIDEIFISINYLKEKFEICHQYSKKHGIKITLIEEPKQMGTVGSISLMKNYLNDPFLLLNGDLFTQPPYKIMLDKFKKSNADILIGMKEEITNSPYGVMDFDKNNRVSKIIEKPARSEWINAGVYLINQKIINLIDKEYMDTPDLIKKVIASNGIVISFDIGPKWLDIGCLDDYENANSVLNEWEYK